MLSNLIKNLTIQYGDYDRASFLSTLGANKIVKHHKTAEYINNKISLRMATYFKL